MDKDEPFPKEVHLPGIDLAEPFEQQSWCKRSIDPEGSSPRKRTKSKVLTACTHVIN